MDVAWGSTANGAAIQIANCSGNPAQQFVLSAAGDLVNPQANKCVDIADWNGERRRPAAVLGLRRRRQPEVAPRLTDPGRSPDSRASATTVYLSTNFRSASTARSLSSA